MAVAQGQVEAGRWFRANRDQEQRATALELFFDLVFVFAVTQLSHGLVEHLTWTGAAQTLFLLLVVWWAWVYTTWMANWLDPDTGGVRLILLAGMLASLLMAIAIPEAFGDRALLFAAAYTALQVVRNGFIAWASPPGSRLRLTFVGILSWSVAVGVLMIGGAVAPEPWMVALWLVALALDYLGPAARYWVPGVLRAETTDWGIEPRHFAERFQLFVIIALGESIVVTGVTASQLEIDAGRVAAIAVAFVGSAALWWLYFNAAATIAGRRLEAAEDPGRLARDAYTYAHIPIVAGIIVTAVGDEIVIAHPGARLGAAELVALAAGPALYLAGHLLFRRLMAGSISRRRLAAALAVVACGALGAWLPALATASLITAVLVAVIVSDQVSAARRRAHGEPTPLEAFEASIQGPVVH
jgi:low temperature requirement protein LtrA